MRFQRTTWEESLSLGRHVTSFGASQGVGGHVVTVQSTDATSSAAAGVTATPALHTRPHSMCAANSAPRTHPISKSRDRRT